MIIVIPDWSKTQSPVSIDSGKHKKFNARLHGIRGFQWVEAGIDLNVDIYDCYSSSLFQITAKDKKPPYNKIFLRKFNFDALLEIKNKGCFYYNFGVDGKGSGKAL